MINVLMLSFFLTTAPMIDTEIESVVSSGDAIVTEEVTEETLESSPQVDLSSLIDEELGGVPVVMVADSTAVAVGDNSGYQMPTYYVDYFTGVLRNLGSTEYLAFCTREYPYGNDYWVEHYRLVYNINVENDTALVGTYPCIDIYRYSSTSNYYVESTTYELTAVPSFSYGSFGTYSALLDYSIGFNEMLVVALVAVLVLWILGRKTLFS